MRAEVRKRRVRLHHLERDDLGRPDGRRRERLDLRANPQAAGHLGHGRQPHATADLYRDRVDRLGNGLAHGDVAEKLFVVVADAPGGAVGLVDHDRRIRDHLRCRDPALQRRRVHEGLEGGSRLALRIGGTVELGVDVVPAADHRADFARRRVQRHEHPLDVGDVPVVRSLVGLRELRIGRVAEPGPAFDALPSGLHRRLGVGLHLQIEGAVDLEAARVELPAEPVVQDATHPFHEVGGLVFDPAGPFGGDRLALPARGLFPGEISLFGHQVQNQVPALQPGVGIVERAVALRADHDCGQQRGLGRVHVDRALAEIVPGRRLKSVPAMGIPDLIHVCLEDLILRIGALQRHGDLPLLQLAQQPLLEAEAIRPHVARELLGDRAAPGARERARSQHLEPGARDSAPVQAAVRVETTVLDRDEGLGHVRGKRLERNQRPPFLAELPDQSGIASVQLARLPRLVGVDLGDGRAVGAQVPPRAVGQAGAGGDQEEQPEPNPARDPADQCCGCLEHGVSPPSLVRPGSRAVRPAHRLRRNLQPFDHPGGAGVAPVPDRIADLAGATGGGGAARPGFGGTGAAPRT